MFAICLCKPAVRGNITAMQYNDMVLSKGGHACLCVCVVCPRMELAVEEGRNIHMV